VDRPAARGGDSGGVWLATAWSRAGGTSHLDGEILSVRQAASEIPPVRPRTRRPARDRDRRGDAMLGRARRSGAM